MAAIERSLGRFAEKGRLTGEDVAGALSRITTATDLHAADEADIVVEAVFENVDVKREIFAALDSIARPDAVLATNTSAIPITTIAVATSRPESVVGTHFFSPVPMMRLCELVRGYKTSDDTMARAREFAENVGKTVIVVNRDVAGFNHPPADHRAGHGGSGSSGVRGGHSRGRGHRLLGRLRPCHGSCRPLI